MSARVGYIANISVCFLGHGVDPLTAPMPRPRAPHPGPLRWNGDGSGDAPGTPPSQPRQFRQVPSPPPPSRRAPPAPPSTQFPIVRGSAIDGHGWSAGDARNPSQLMELGSGGQGRNRTNDTRIFSPLL